MIATGGADGEVIEISSEDETDQVHHQELRSGKAGQRGLFRQALAVLSLEAKPRSADQASGNAQSERVDAVNGTSGQDETDQVHRQELRSGKAQQRDLLRHKSGGLSLEAKPSTEDQEHRSIQSGTIDVAYEISSEDETEQVRRHELRSGKAGQRGLLRHALGGMHLDGKRHTADKVPRSKLSTRADAGNVDEAPRSSVKGKDEVSHSHKAVFPQQGVQSSKLDAGKSATVQHTDTMSKDIMKTHGEVDPSRQVDQNSESLSKHATPDQTDEAKSCNKVDLLRDAESTKADSGYAAPNRQDITEPWSPKLDTKAKTVSLAEAYGRAIVSFAAAPPKTLPSKETLGTSETSPSEWLEEERHAHQESPLDGAGSTQGEMSAQTRRFLERIQMRQGPGQGIGSEQTASGMHWMPALQ
eukprot:TRINITY_DN5195_c0_g1_i1.p1 TRINITY_DN5195_c0_g1~~TRINITY_DN5195_c0_g1_i1.p1  ORF type:complete len:414 (+),score=56.15 TRINITY_DN5195_c0_g1_i1:29-1270(+)